MDRQAEAEFDFSLKLVPVANISICPTHSFSDSHVESRYAFWGNERICFVTLVNLFVCIHNTIHSFLEYDAV